MVDLGFDKGGGAASVSSAGVCSSSFPSVSSLVLIAPRASGPFSKEKATQGRVLSTQLEALPVGLRQL